MILYVWRKLLKGTNHTGLLKNKSCDKFTISTFSTIYLRNGKAYIIYIGYRKEEIYVETEHKLCFSLKIINHRDALYV